MHKNISIYKCERLWLHVLVISTIFTVITIDRICYRFSTSLSGYLSLLTGLCALAFFIATYIITRQHTLRLRSANYGIKLYFYDSIFFCPWQFVKNIEMKNYNLVLSFHELTNEHIDILKSNYSCLALNIASDLTIVVDVGGTGFLDKHKCNSLRKLLQEQNTEQNHQPYIKRRISFSTRQFLIFLFLTLGIFTLCVIFPKCF